MNTAVYHDKEFGETYYRQVITEPITEDPDILHNAMLHVLEATDDWLETEGLERAVEGAAGRWIEIVVRTKVKRP